MCAVFEALCDTRERRRTSALRCGEGSWTPDLSGVFSSAGNLVISSVLSPLRKGFLDLFVLAAALASTSESSISWIPRSPRRKTSNSSSSHFRTGVGRELPLALKISLSNNFHMKYIYYPSLSFSQNWLSLFLTQTLWRCSGFLILSWLFAWFHHQPGSG